MTTKRRDRRGRGIRGPLAWPNHWTGEPVPIPRLPRHRELFDLAVSDSVAKVRARVPEAVREITIGVEEIPPPQAPWATAQIPLAAAIEATETEPAQIVFYRRPIEHRAASPRGIRILVYRAFVEQLAALTGRPVSDFDDFDDPDP